jgi:hypothetical protein
MQPRYNKHGDSMKDDGGKTGGGVCCVRQEEVEGTSDTRAGSRKARVLIGRILLVEARRCQSQGESMANVVLGPRDGRR